MLVKVICLIPQMWALLCSLLPFWLFSTWFSLNSFVKPSIMHDIRSFGPLPAPRCICVLGTVCCTWCLYVAPCTKHCCLHAHLSADQLCLVQAKSLWSTAAGERVSFSRAPGAKDFSLVLREGRSPILSWDQVSMPSHPAKTCFPVAWGIYLWGSWQMRGPTTFRSRWIYGLDIFQWHYGSQSFHPSKLFHFLWYWFYHYDYSCALNTAAVLQRNMATEIHSF